MKSTKLTLGLLIITALFFQACRKGSMWGIEGKGPVEYQNREVADFNAIDLGVEGDIEYVQDSVYKVSVSGQNNIVAILETKVVNRELQFSFRRNVWRYDRLHFVIHSPDMISIKISGSGDVNVKDYIKGYGLTLKISGSGNITVPTVTLQNIEAKISGSGNININGGTCNDEDFTISGSGTIMAGNLKALTGEARLSGSGEILMNASDKIDVSISGSGTVKYKGRPAITNSISGSGKLLHVE